MTPIGEAYSTALALLFALAAGLVGSFALLNRMILAGDVVSHIALPGLALAFLLQFNPLLGGAATLLLGTLLIWRLQRGTGLAIDATIGVVFAGAVALGAVLTPEEDLVEALFGKFQELSLLTFLLGVVLVAIIIASVVHSRNEMILNLFSPDLAAVTGVRLDRLNLQFLLMFSLTILVGLRFMGALLAGCLIIIPATTARRMASNVSGFLVVSSCFSLIAVAIGILLHVYVLRAASLGPTIVLVSVGIFGLSFLRPSGL